MGLKVSLKAAAVTAVLAAGTVLGAAPSQAAGFGSGTLDAVNISGGSATVLGTDLTSGDINDVTGIDFTSGIEASLGTGAFTRFNGGVGDIKDLSFTNGVSGPVDDFFTILQPNSTNKLFFDLSSAVAHFTNTDLAVVFNGVFSDDRGVIGGSGTLTTQLNLRRNGLDRPSTFSISTESVPTPALLPGLVGMGVAALRKRKSVGELDTSEA